MLEAKARTTVDTGAPLHATAARFGFTITKKVGNAVERNRMRRRLKEAVRKLQGVHALGGTDYVLIARRPLLDCDFAQLMQDLEGALQRVKGPANGRAIEGRRATHPKPTQSN